MECELTSQRQVEKLYSLPLKLELPNATAVRNRLATKYGKFFVLFKVFLKIVIQSYNLTLLMAQWVDMEA